MWARILAAAMSGLLLLLGLCGFFVVRPLHWDLILVAVWALGLAADLLYGAFRGQWPIAALLRLAP